MTIVHNILQVVMVAERKIMSPCSRSRKIISNPRAFCLQILQAHAFSICKLRVWHPECRQGAGKHAYRKSEISEFQCTPVVWKGLLTFQEYGQQPSGWSVRQRLGLIQSLQFHRSQTEPWTQTPGLRQTQVYQRRKKFHYMYSDNE